MPHTDIVFFLRRQDHRHGPSLDRQTTASGAVARKAINEMRTIQKSLSVCSVKIYLPRYSREAGRPGVPGAEAQAI
jgi:hypothetical protein